MKPATEKEKEPLRNVQHIYTHHQEPSPAKTSKRSPIFPKTRLIDLRVRNSLLAKVLILTILASDVFVPPSAIGPPPGFQSSRSSDFPIGSLIFRSPTLPPSSLLPQPKLLETRFSKLQPLTHRDKSNVVSYKEKNPLSHNNMLAF